MSDLFDDVTAGRLLRALVPLLVAALLGCGVSLTYILLTPARRRSTRMGAALVLLTVIISLIAQVVNDLAGAFIIVGALTLVRLRAAIDNMLEFSFLLLAIAVGMGVGEQQYIVSILGAVFVAVLAFAINPRAAAPAAAEPQVHQLRLQAPASALARVQMLIEALPLIGGLQMRGVGDNRFELRARIAGPSNELAPLAQALGAEPGVEGLEIRSSGAGRAA